MENQWIELFKTGTWTDASGTTRTFNQADIDKIFAASEGKDFPAVIGHPKTDSPAWGWKAALKCEGGSIWAKFRDLVPEFVDMVKKKMFPNRSIALNADYSIRHVGFLGAVPPAVKGLTPIEHATEAPMFVIEFSDPEDSVVADFFRRIREWMIEKFGTAEADRVIPSDQLGFIQDSAAQDDDEPAGYNNKEDIEMQLTEEQLNKKIQTAIEAATATFSQKLVEKDKEIETLKAGATEKEKAARSNEIKAFVEGLKKEGKFLPAWEKMGVVEFMAQIEQGGTEIEFAEGKKETPGAFFRRFLAELPKTVEFGAIADEEMDFADTSGGQGPENKKETVDQERQELHKKALQYQAKNQGVTYLQAVMAVTKK